MGIELETKDCTSVTDAELEEMADLCAEGENAFSIGLLSKQTEEWVLVTTARENGKLKGYLFSTLERIGGTPAVLIGLGSVVRNSKRETVLRGLMIELSRKALMAFPDEDVLFGAQFNDASAFESFKTLQDIVPRPDHRANGEERAWGRRLAKRFAIPATRYDDRAFVVTGGGEQARVVDHMTLKPEAIDGEVAAYFTEIDLTNGDAIIACGWAEADQLMKLG